MAYSIWIEQLAALFEEADLRWPLDTRALRPWFNAEFTPAETLAECLSEED